jgi:capsular polysaccharide biosynthesis protein
MRAAGTDAIGMLRWGLARYRWLFLACLLLGAVGAPLIAQQRPATADAQALVIANQQTVSLSAIPRYGEAVFNNGVVAQTIATKFEATGDEKDIIPDRVSLVSEQDSIVFGVVGHDPDPKTAADLANTAATAFVDALNSGGGGVGTFKLQSKAEPPGTPKNTLGTVFAIPVGLLAGLVLGLAAVSVLLVARRPVVTGADAEETTGVPGIGTVSLPRTRQGRSARPEEFEGLIPVCRRLLGLPTPTVVLVSRPRDETARMKLTEALVDILRFATHVPPLHSEASDGTPNGDGDMGARHRQSGLKRVGRTPLTVVDGGELANLVQPPQSMATVLVVPEGISSAALRTAVVEHLGGSAEARILLFRPGARSRGQEVRNVEAPEEVRAPRAAGAPIT